MTNPANSTVQNLLPVQAYFDENNNFVTFIGQNKPFYATPDPYQSGLHITNSTIDSTTIGATTPSTGVFTSGQVLATPVGSTDIANKLYVDSTAAGLSWKQPVAVATTVNITLSGLQLIDGYTTLPGDRVLVKNQGTASENGIYIASSGPWSRSEDANSWNELVSAITFIEFGGQLSTAWYCSAQPGGTLGVTPVNWSNFSVAGVYYAGTGLSLAAYTFSITNTGVVAGSYGTDSRSVTLAINAQGQITSAVDQPIAIANTQVSGLGTMSTQNSNSVAITGGNIDGTAVGTTTASTVRGSTITATTQFTGAGTGLTGTATSLSIGGNAATATSATTATNIAGGAAGSLPYQSAASTTALLAAGTDGQILTLASGLPSWTTPASGMVYPGAGIPNSTGSAWGTSYSTTGTGTVVALATSPSLSSPTIDGANPYISFADGTAVTVAAGRLWYNGTTGSWNAGMGNGNITQQIGEELFVYGKASSAITDSPLQCIYQTGVVGASGVITFAPTVAGITDGESIIGIATESLALNAFGRVTSFGTVRGITTDGAAYGETWVDGDKIWYNPVTGGLTKVKPVAPNIKVQVGIVINAGSGGSGSFSVELAHGSELGGTDSNVQLTSPTGGQLLTYNQTGAYWQNTSLTAGSNVTITPATNGGITIASSSAITVADDTSTNASRYLTFTSATSGTISTVNTSSTKLAYNPSTGLLSLISATFAGTTSATALKTANITELASVTGTAPAATTNFYVATGAVQYITANTANNWTLNFAFSSGTSLNTAMATNDSISVTLMVTNSTTAYYPTAFTIDGTSVTPKWQGGTAPTSGNASSIDAYTFVIIKTASATYTVLGSQTQFK